MTPGIERLVAWENLLHAFDLAAKGKRGRADVAAFEYRLEEELITLRDELSTGVYRPGPYLHFLIHDPKRRLISAAPFRDRVVHHALCNLIQPAFERAFVADTFANRPGKGTHRALDHAQAHCRRYRYALQLDLRQFFPSIDHALLREALARKVQDAGLMRLVDLILESGRGVLDDEYEMVFFPGDDLLAVERPRGLPIGNLTSQLWANVYLSGIDHFIKRELRCPGYVRYVDDLVLFGDDKSVVWAWKAALEERLARLRLTIHPGAHPRPVTEGIPFLGFVLYPGRRRLKRRKGVTFQRRLDGMVREYDALPETDERIAARVDGWLNHVRYGNTVGLAKALLAGLPAGVRPLLHSPSVGKVLGDSDAPEVPPDHPARPLESPSLAFLRQSIETPGPPHDADIRTGDRGAEAAHRRA